MPSSGVVDTGAVSSPRSKNPVMFDVARLAGVSHQTVSRVLNGKPGVSDPVRERVEVAIAQLGYRRNTTARALATRRSMNIGVISVGTSQYGPATTLLGIADAARRAGYTTSLVSLADSEINSGGMKDALDHLLDNAVDGIILMTPVAAALSAADGLSANVPMVLFQPGARPGIDHRPRIAVDEMLGARLATRHLLDLGHETVWHLAGPDGWLGTDARIRGWRDELTDSRRVAPPVFTGDWSPASGFAAAKEIVDRPEVTALFVANDQMALGVLHALHQYGRAVPAAVSIVGFDGTPESEFYEPSLTTVRLDFAEAGRRCVGQLLEAIDPTPTTAGAHRDGPLSSVTTAPVLIPPELVIRGSSAPPSR